MVWIIFAIAASLLISFSASGDLSNRLLHALTGGFVSFFICFLVVKNANFRITRFQFFIFSFLVVTALGVANEILEFALQNYAEISITQTVNDTWLDLISNTLGSFLAASIFSWFISRPLEE